MIRDRYGSGCCLTVEPERGGGAGVFPIGRLRSALRVGAPSNSLRQPICGLVAGIPAADDQVLVPVVGTRGWPTVGLYICIREVQVLEFSSGPSIRL